MLVSLQFHFGVKSANLSKSIGAHKLPFRTYVIITDLTECHQ